MTTPAAKGSKENNFDSLRLIFAVLVILSHSFPLTSGSNSLEPLARVTGGQITFGNISVWAFFAISGYLITQSWQRSPNLGKYLKKRVARIYPAFAVAALLTAMLIVPRAADPATFVPVSLVSYLGATLSLHSFHYPPLFTANPMPNVLNGSLWSIPCEFLCYLGVLALGLAGLLRRRWLVVAIFALALGCHLWLDLLGLLRSETLVLGFSLYRATVLPFFLAGAVFQVFGGKALLRGRWIAAAAVLLVASGFVPHGLVVTLPTCGAYLLMALAYLPLLHPLNLGRFGDFSYGTYLYAFPIQQLLVQRAHGQIAPLTLFAEAAPLTLIAGVLSWFLVEKHFLPRSSVLKHEGIVPPAIQAPDAAGS